MNSIFTPDRFITVLGLAISVVSLLAFRKMSRKLLGAVILILTVVFGAQTWFLLQFERSVIKQDMPFFNTSQKIRERSG